MRNETVLLSATTICHYVRVEQCDRYLHLSLHGSAVEALLERYRALHVQRPFLSSVLTAAGRAWEDAVVASLSPPLHRFADGDSTTTLAVIDALAVGDECCLIQAPITGLIGAWMCQGQPDIVRVRRRTEQVFDLCVVEIKASHEERIEHRLQVAFYLRLLKGMLEDSGWSIGKMQGGVIARGSADRMPGLNDPEILFDVEPYDLVLNQLIADEDSDVARTMRTPLADTPYSLGRKCDGCRFNQICMVDSAERQDIALIPFVRSAELRVLRAHGVHTLRDLVELTLLPGPDDWYTVFAAVPEQAERVAELRRIRTLGASLDRLAQRARILLQRFDPQVTAYRHLLDGAPSLLPADEANPDLVKVFLDLQHDPLSDRIYLIGGLVQGPRGERISVRVAPTLPDGTIETEIVEDLLQEVLTAILEMARDPEAVPIFVYLYDSYDLQVLQDLIGRVLPSLNADPRFEGLVGALSVRPQRFTAALAAEVRDRRNLDLSCQNLYGVASRLGFTWRSEAEYFPRRFRWGIFDALRPRDDGVWIETASRFGSSLPLEYIYGAWGLLPEDSEAMGVPKECRDCTRDSLGAFVSHRLRAMQHIEATLRAKNQQLSVKPLALYGAERPKFDGLLRALESFLELEHQAALQERLALYSRPIEQRVETGRSLILECVEVNTEYRTASFRFDYRSLGWYDRTAYPALRFKQEDWVVLNPADGRSPWRIIHGRLAIIQRIDDAGVDLQLLDLTAGHARFRYWHDRSLIPTVGARYTLDEMADDLNFDRYVAALRHADDNPLFKQLTGQTSPMLSPQSMERQERFMAAMRSAASAQTPTQAQEAAITDDGHRTLCVQGPPGSGKTATAGWMILARLYASTERPMRVLVCTRTHVATKLVLRSVVECLARLGAEAAELQDLLVAKVGGDEQDPAMSGISILGDATNGSILDEVWTAPLLVLGGTAGGISTLLKRRDRHSHLFDLLVIDEASQMSIPEALLAAMWLKPDGRIVVMGDHRQLPPILHHRWGERDTSGFSVHRSIFEYLLEIGIPCVRLDESFRLHRSQAAFLAEHIYDHDGIAFHSRRLASLPRLSAEHSAYVAAVLRPDVPIIVLEHTEAESQQSNSFEALLIAPLLAACEHDLGLDGLHGVGVVVPHRAQRVALCRTFPSLASGIDTVERFQGDERDVIILAATASDPAYILEEAQFLLQPNRLTVAISRPRLKLIVIAAQTLFRTVPSNTNLFEHALLWKRLRHAPGMELLWQGPYARHTIRVFGLVQHPA